jgi:hypothetical protein
VLGYVKHLVDVSLEMSVVLFHSVFFRSLTSSSSR